MPNERGEKLPQLTNAEYHSLPAVSKSHLDLIARSPRHYWHRYLNPEAVPPEPTPAMVVGSAVHTRALEPDRYELEYAVAPAIDRRTKAGKEAWEAFQADAKGKTVLTAEQHELSAAVAAAVREHPAAALVLGKPGACEQSYQWTDETTGEVCKCRPDWLSECGRLVVDLKTTDDASPAAFQRSVQKFRYHVQAAWYLRGLGAEQFVFIAVEKAPPYLVGVYVATPEMVAAGGRVADRDLARLAECRAANAWPGYGDEIQPIDLPRWCDD
jgi:exodeoxyribonuclease VIII